MTVTDRLTRRSHPADEAAITRAWLGRFGSDAPAFAGHLVRRILASLDGRNDAAGVREAAQALGVLRAQQGHAVAGLVEDLGALRSMLPEQRRTGAVVDEVLTAAAAAYVDELTAILEARATRDPLTGLPNRAAFTEALRHEIAAAARTSPPALLLVDLDGFKAVNDTDGHLAGDAVLVAVAELLAQKVRGEDLACRLGGDEFAVILPRTTQPRAVQVAQRLLTASRSAAGLSSENARVSMSIGIGWLADPRDNDELVAVADAALYRVKSTGGDGIGRSRVEDRGSG